MNLVSVSGIWLFVLAVCFGFSKTWLFDLFGFDPDSGFSFETDSQKDETGLKWIRISETASTSTFLFSYKFETESKQNRNQTRETDLVSDSVNLASDLVTNRTYLFLSPALMLISENFLQEFYKNIRKIKIIGTKCENIIIHKYTYYVKSKYLQLQGWKI